jgi:hypothetical protein
MLTGWANDIALVTCGFAVGAMAAVAHRLTPAAFAEAAHDWRKGERLLEGMERRAREQQEVIETGPRSFRLAGYAQLAVIAVVVLAIWIGPISFGWVIFAGVAAGAAAAYGAWEWLRRGTYDPAR